MSVEFISLTYPNASTELKPIPNAQIDKQFLIRYARAVDEAGFDYTLLPYHSNGFDPFTIAAAITQYTEHVRPIIALRPNTVYPTVAAKALATLDQLSEGRATVHFIAGGDNREQAREGDFLEKSQRYARTKEYIEILRKAWSSENPFDYDGEFYQFQDFHSHVRTVNGHIPISLGGSSDDAYRVGGSLADIFALWGEPLQETQDQLDAIYAAAAAAGRKDRPRIWTTFRPIIAPTEDLAWDKAHRILDTLKASNPAAASASPANVGSQRALAIAKSRDVHDRALWTAPALATGARGASTALVGTPETVAAAILDYIDLGIELISIRGYDNLNDVIDYGRYVLPLVREELARRQSGAQAPALQGEAVA